MRAVHAFVTGQVQGVYFRQTTRQTARELGLVGWVRNLADGRVEVWAQGGDDEVDRMVEWLWSGPAGAHVSGVETETVPADDSLQDFLVTR